MSCIYKRESRSGGVFYYKGFGRRISLKTRNELEAKRLKQLYDQKFRKEDARGEKASKPKQVTFSVAIEQYIRYKSLSVQQFSERTIRNDASRLNLIHSYTGNIKLSSMGVDTINDYIDKRKRNDRDISWGTLRGDLKVWKAFLNWCKNVKRYIARNPFDQYGRIPDQRKTKEVLTAEQLKQLWNYEHPRLPWVNKGIRIAILTGFRRGEIATLRWDNITDEIIRVKGKNSRRFQDGLRPFPNNEDIQAVLNSMERRGPWVFSQQEDPSKHLSDWWIYKCIRTALDSVGAVNVSLHNIRDTFATNAARKGTDPYALKELPGHSDIKTTMVYVQPVLPKSPIKGVPEE